MFLQKMFLLDPSSCGNIITLLTLYSKNSVLPPHFPQASVCQHQPPTPRASKQANRQTGIIPFHVAEQFVRAGDGRRQAACTRRQNLVSAELTRGNMELDKGQRRGGPAQITHVLRHHHHRHHRLPRRSNRRILRND